MQFHTGRLIDHIQLRVSDLDRSKRFYRTVLVELGLREAFVDGRNSFRVDELYVTQADGPVSRVHLAFQAQSREVVDSFYDAALSSGGRDNGAPGERDYHPGYYGAFILDPDGNNIEAVFHGPLNRTAPSVILTPVK